MRIIFLFLLISVSANSAEINKKFLFSKLSSWFFKNQSFSYYKKHTKKLTRYEPISLVNKILDIYENSFPSNNQAYAESLEGLIKYSSIEFDESTRNRLKNAIKRVLNKVKRRKLNWELLRKKSFVSNKVKKNQDSKSSEIILILKDFLGKLPGNFPFEIKAKKTLNVLEDLLFSNLTSDDCYRNDTTCQFSSNKGFVNYFSKRVKEDHDLFLASLKVGIFLENFNMKIKPINPDILSFSPYNFWPQIYSLVGDKKKSLLALTVFGHDACCSKLENTGMESQVLNPFSYSKNGSDKDPKSWLYVPGIISKRNISKKKLQKLLDSKKIFEKYNHSEKETFLRAGYYHFYGGILTSFALLEENLGKYHTVDSSIFFSQALGFIYKYIQTFSYLSKDANKLWNSIDKTDYIKKLSRPNNWSLQRYKKAHSELVYLINIIDYTEAQHREGALFASKIFREY